MDRPVGVGVGWQTVVGSTGRARARGQARAGGRDSSWATAPPWRGIRAESARVARVSAPRGASSFLSPRFRPGWGEALLHHSGFPERGWPAGETEARDPDRRLHCASPRRNRRPRGPQRNAGARPSPGGPVVNWHLGSAGLKSAERLDPQL
ncbi:uncharacterized protein LOC105738291 [Nomascus leucogenys]|uniref:uncharacterized protein LOC105738291 n=1 Tax=Nomascus leucogenys TaxID=61853 RepID=UPI00122D90DF|nr:uncharacterized protein LOC105738291 [Nomascus leucogenys]